MKFVCERCHTKYSIADEKVRGKVLKVRCKTCANVVTVRETGATIDDSAGAGPKAAPFSKSGSVESTKSRAPKPAILPSEALLAPGAPVSAPPPRKSHATAPITPPSPIEGIEWYLAVDGAQTGPFPQSRLCDKILALPAGVDVHVWNGTFDTWKPPQTVPELQAELGRRRRAPTPPHAPPPLRRPSGAVPLAAASSARPASVGLAEIDPGPPLSKSQAPVPKANGVPNGAAGGAAPALAGFGLEDLVGEPDGTATPLPAAPTGAALGHAAPALGSGVRQTRPSAAGVARFEVSGPVHVGRAGVRPIKLVLGALGVAIVLCGIVGIWMLRKPPPAAAVAVETPPKPAAADFAGLAEKLAKEEAAQPPPPTAEVKPKPEEAPAAVVDVKPATGSPTKGTRRSRRKNQALAPPPLGLGATPTEEEREAASRFGDSTGRDVKLAAQAGGGSRSTTTPAQADISRVINNNRQGIQTCYQRALLRDNTLTHGKVTVRVSIGLSGKVKSVSLDAPVQFRALEPCIREVMSRWAFPPSSEEYGTEFPVVLQGNQ